jgi:hypothetical protein
VSQIANINSHRRNRAQIVVGTSVEFAEAVAELSQQLDLSVCAVCRLGIAQLAAATPSVDPLLVARFDELNAKTRNQRAHWRKGCQPQADVNTNVVVS